MIFIFGNMYPDFRSSRKIFVKPILILLGIAGVIAVALTVVACAGIGLTRGQYESPVYQVLDSSDKEAGVEIRKYEDYTVASTGSADVEEEKNARNGGFMTLFRYIDGDNESEQKIAMTSPVFMQGDAVVGKMSFVVPAEVEEAGAPKPTNEDVRLESVPGGTFAVLRFKGSRSNESATQALEKLNAWLAGSSFSALPDGSPRFAYYDPPWVPEALRRNEVLVPLSMD